MHETVRPVDELGNVLPHDDPRIENDDWILRKIDPDKHIVYDPKSPTNYRVSSAAFSESSRNRSRHGGMSIQIEKLVVDVVSLVGSGWGLLRIHVGSLRGQPYLVGSEPLPGDVAHGNVWHPPAGKPGKPLKILHLNNEWLICPDLLKP